MENVRSFAVVHTNELKIWSSIDCMPICEMDVESVNKMKEYLAKELGATPLEGDVWTDNDTYIYAQGDNCNIGVKHTDDGDIQLFIYHLRTNADVVYDSLQNLQDKFGVDLVGSPNVVES